MNKKERYDERDLSAIQSANLLREDAGQSIFFARELEHIKTKSYDVLFPNLTATRMIPVSMDAGSGAKTITYRQYENVGFAKIISNYATDLPRTDVTGKEFSSPIRAIGNSYGYNIDDIRAAQMSGKPLEQRRANAARQADAQLVNQIAYKGDTANGLNGFFTHPNITSYTLPTDGVGNGTTAGTVAAAKFVNKTPDQVLRDLNGIVNTPTTLTNGVENVDTVLLSHTVFSDLNTRPRSTTSDTSILQYFKNNNPGVTVERIPECAGAGAGGTDIVVAYTKSPDKLTLEIPQAFEQFPPQAKGLEFEIPCHSKCGGVIIYYPLSICKAEGC